MRIEIQARDYRSNARAYHRIPRANPESERWAWAFFYGGTVRKGSVIAGPYEVETHQARVACVDKCLSGTPRIVSLDTFNYSIPMAWERSEFSGPALWHGQVCRLCCCTSAQSQNIEQIPSVAKQKTCSRFDTPRGRRSVVNGYTRFAYFSLGTAIYSRRTMLACR